MKATAHSMIPYNMKAIVFLVPILCFNKKPVEDPSMNWLKDGYQLWNVVCMSPSLMCTQMILLNKCDILTLMLCCSIHIRDSLPSFGNQENNSKSCEGKNHHVRRKEWKITGAKRQRRNGKNKTKNKMNTWSQ